MWYYRSIFSTFWLKLILLKAGPGWNWVILRKVGIAWQRCLISSVWLLNPNKTIPVNCSELFAIDSYSYTIYMYIYISSYWFIFTHIYIYIHLVVGYLISFPIAYSSLVVEFPRWHWIPRPWWMARCGTTPRTRYNVRSLIHCIGIVDNGWHTVYTHVYSIVWDGIEKSIVRHSITV